MSSGGPGVRSCVTTVERRDRNVADLTLAARFLYPVVFVFCAVMFISWGRTHIASLARFFVTEVDLTRSEQIDAIGRYLDHGNGIFVVSISPPARIIVGATVHRVVPN